jgi:two-component system KDP operon response regulator KdpE
VSDITSLVMVIEDDAAMRRFLRASLAAAGYRVVEAETGDAALKQAPLQPPDCVLLDLGLPDMDGLEVIRNFRTWSQVPVVVVSARGREKDKVAALDAGADDYLTKPFGVPELLARIRVAMRHAARVAAGADAEAAEFVVGDLRVDLAARRVNVADKEVHLSPLEYRLLATLVRHAGKVLTHRFLLEEVWGPPYVEEMHYLRVYMASLRGKLEADPARPQYLLTEQGVGYRLADE